MMKTSFGGPPPEKGCSLLAPSIVSLLVTIALLSLGRVFRGLRFLCKRPFLLGRQS
jgi:hypothetical protein